MINFIKILIIATVAIILVGCGKLKTENTVKVNDTNHRVDVVHNIDFVSLETFFKPICKDKYKALTDDATRETMVATCVSDNIEQALQALSAATGGN